MQEAWSSSSQLPGLLKQKKLLCSHLLVVPVVCASITGLFHSQPALARKPVSFPSVNLRRLCRSQRCVFSWKLCFFFNFPRVISQCYTSPQHRRVHLSASGSKGHQQNVKSPQGGEVGCPRVCFPFVSGFESWISSSLGL